MTSTKQHIAVVDDEVEGREMIGEYLALHDYRVSLCDGGASLRELMSRDVPDLIILDLNMPEEDGLSIVRWMKQLLDLALQVADASAGTPLRDVAREAADRLRRGVVAYSSVS